MSVVMTQFHTYYTTDIQHIITHQTFLAQDLFYLGNEDEAFIALSTLKRILITKTIKLRKLWEKLSVLT